MLNNVMLIGKYYHMTKLKDGRNKIFIIIADDKKDITLPVYVSESIVNYIKRCCNEGDLFGVKAIFFKISFHWQMIYTC